MRHCGSDPTDRSASSASGSADSRLADRIKDAIRTYDAEIFICSECGRLAFMIDPGDGLIDHLEDEVLL
jgi:hypothetical protein